MVAVFALVGQAFVEPGHQARAVPALGLSKTALGLPQLVRVRSFFARRQGQERVEPRVNADGSSGHRRDGVGGRVDTQTERPARRPLDDPATFEESGRKGLGMKAHVAQTWNEHMCARRGFERIGERDAGQLVALAFESGLLCQLFEAARPRQVGGIQHALQRMAWDAKLSAVM